MYAIYYFIVNFSNYLFPQYAERGLGLSPLTSGWLNSFSGLVTFGVVVVYTLYSARVTNKRPMMVIGCLCMAASAFWMARLPADATIWALLGPLAIKGLFGVMMILSIASLTWRGLDDAHFAKAYQTKNVMRQMMVSLATAAAAVALQHQRTAEQGKLIGGGVSDPASAVDMQAVFISSQHLYLWVAVLALIAGAIVLVQKKLR